MRVLIRTGGCHRIHQTVGKAEIGERQEGHEGT